MINKKNTSLVLLIGACNMAWADEKPEAQERSSRELALPDTTVYAEQASLTVPSTARAIANIQRIPGAVEVVADTAFKDGPSQTIKDVLGWVPGVFAQPRFGDDARVSIRGSGLSRNYGNRGINVYMDGVSINTSDGLVDLFEVDPTAYRYVEVFKGANALRYGGNSLGGAINFVTPTGRDASLFDGRIDAGSFGYLRSQASTGGAQGQFDYFITGSAQSFDGYRDHSDGKQQRLSSNFGYQFSEDVETRFYVNANKIKQRLPGEVTKYSALHSPRTADSEFERLDQQRNIDSVRVANKTTLRFDSTTLEFGVFGVHRQVKHPIYQWLDYDVNDYGGFVRATDELKIGDYRNQLITGINLHNGKIDNKQYENQTNAVKGELLASNIDESKNASAYAQNSFYIRPNIALIAGMQFQHSVRDRQDRFQSDGDQSGRRSYDNFSPKVGVLWDVDPTWQVFSNISRSAEVPSYDANTFTSASSSDLDAQTATTYEIGTRGQREDTNWDLALYRAQIKNELQCLTTAPWSPCSVVNADKTVHQGVEAGFGAAFLKSAVASGDSVWFNAAYTYNDFFFDNDSRYGDNELPGVPQHYLRAEVLYKHPSGFYLGPNTEWVPKSYYADNDNQEKVDPYTLWNLKIGYDDLASGWSGYLEGRNIFDTRYISSTAIAGTATEDSALYNPGVGRALYAGVRLNW
ncbi:TonB-dependent receptor family protein [Pseudomonas sp. S9]|uniref:TonB-dependent receptor family protein n=1 Tax=Pseudomonas sp. S9 TaxID=686578 RepID=UPI0002556790|nr:TonB-dependent receptor [Pseudomonas sp. S9]